MSMEKFMQLASDNQDEDFWFFAEEVPKEILKDCSPRHQLKLKDQTWVYFSVWMGEGGATTASHFDIDDNFYVQFYGRKRFLLFPPSAHMLWKSYPRLSVNHKQVQMHNNDRNRYAYKLCDGAALPCEVQVALGTDKLTHFHSYQYLASLFRQYMGVLGSGKDRVRGSLGVFRCCSASSTSRPLGSPGHGWRRRRRCCCSLRSCGG